MRFDVYRVLETALVGLSIDFVDSITNEHHVTGYPTSLLFQIDNETVYKQDTSFLEGLIFLNFYGDSEQAVVELMRNAETTLIQKTFEDAKVRIFHIEKYSSYGAVFSKEIGKFMSYSALKLRWEVL